LPSLPHTAGVRRSLDTTFGEVSLSIPPSRSQHFHIESVNCRTSLIHPANLALQQQIIVDFQFIMSRIPTPAHSATLAGPIFYLLCKYHNGIGVLRDDCSNNVQQIQQFIRPFFLNNTFFFNRILYPDLSNQWLMMFYST
jgi:hypothetical protein